MSVARLSRVVCFSFLISSTFLSAGPGETKVRNHKSLFTNDRCPALYAATTDAIRALGSTNGVARLALADNLGSIIEEASDKSTAEASLAAIEEIKNAARSLSSTRYTVNFYETLLEHNMIAVCVLPPNSSAGQQAASHCAFAGLGQEAIILTPVANKLDPNHFGITWAMNFLKTVAMPAGERFLMEWMRDAYKRVKKDTYYTQFVSERYSGTFPPPHGSVKQGFALLIMQMFQSLTQYELVAEFMPDELAKNVRHSNRSDYLQLSEGQNSKLVSPIMEALGITQDNFLDKAQEIIYKMNETLNSQIDSN